MHGKYIIHVSLKGVDNPIGANIQKTNQNTNMTMMWTNSLTQQDEIVFRLPAPMPSDPSDDEDEGIHVPLHQPSLSGDDNDDHHHIGSIHGINSGDR